MKPLHLLVLFTFVEHSLAFPSLVIRPHGVKAARYRRDTGGGSPDIQISQLHVESDIQLRYARTLVTSQVRNSGDHPGIAEFKVIREGS